MASVKWLKRITILDRKYEGFFQTDRYVIEDEDGNQTPLANMGVKSMIGSPSEGGRRHARRPVLHNRDGVVGMGKIERIQVSCDGGETWEEAEMVGPSERYAWQPWRSFWKPEAPGEYTLMSRAVDALGNEQPMESRWNRLGYMVNGVRPVTVTVSERTA